MMDPVTTNRLMMASQPIMFEMMTQNTEGNLVPIVENMKIDDAAENANFETIP